MIVVKAVRYNSGQHGKGEISLEQQSPIQTSGPLKRSQLKPDTVNLANSLWLERSQILEGEPTIAMLPNQYNSQLHSKYLSLCPQRNSFLQKKETIPESQN